MTMPTHPAPPQENKPEPLVASFFFMRLSLGKLKDADLAKATHYILIHNRRHYKLLGYKTADDEKINGTVTVDLQPHNPTFTAIIATDKTGTSYLPFLAGNDLLGIPYSKLESTTVVTDHNNKTKSSILSLVEGFLMKGSDLNKQNLIDIDIIGFFNIKPTDSKAKEQRHFSDAGVRNSRHDHYGIASDIPWFYRGNEKAYINKTLNETDTAHLTHIIKDLSMTSGNLLEFYSDDMGRPLTVSVEDLLEIIKLKISEEQFKTIKDLIRRLAELEILNRMLREQNLIVSDKFRDLIDDLEKLKDEGLQIPQDHLFDR